MAAKREGQGLQIAVIAFAMLTIILAITTYVFYAQSQTAAKDLDAKNKTLADKQKENDKLLYRVAAMNYVLGLKGVGLPEVEQFKSRAGDDADVKEVLDGFASDMALIGDQVAPDGPRNYRTFSTVLLTALAKKNASVADANQQVRTAQQEKDKGISDEAERAKVAVEASSKASEELKKEQGTFVSFRADMEEKNSKLATQIAKSGDQAKKDQQKLIDENQLFAKQNVQQQGTIKKLTETVKGYKDEAASLFENPDGRIKLVNQRQRLVWIDAGSADGLLRQTTLSVYDHDENGVSSDKKKARVEVVNVGEHISEARILEDTPANPIIAGDIVHTPAWSPGQRVHFALAMKMDINKDRIDDYDMVKNIILLNGGVIDAELRPDGTRIGNITVDTRYFVEGERPSEVTNPELMKQYTPFDDDRARSAVEKISVEKLLSLMGWKAEERTVELAGPKVGGDFRQRTPGKKAPAATTPAAEAAPAPSSPAATPPAGGVDPFATPPAAPKAAPAAEIDPFAAPK